MQIFLILINMLLLPLSANALTELIISENKIDITIHIDHKKHVWIGASGLKSNIYYDPVKSFIYSQTPPGNAAYFLSTHMPGVNIPQAHLERDNLFSNPTKYKGHKITVWRLYVDKKLCGKIYFSKNVQRVSSLSFTDISRINNALGFLSGNDIENNPCIFYDVPKALGNFVGFPVYSKTIDSESSLKHMKNLKVVSNIEIPKMAQALTEDAHVEFILSTLPMEKRRSIVNSWPAGFGVREKLAALKLLLK